MYSQVCFLGTLILYGVPLLIEYSPCESLIKSPFELVISNFPFIEENCRNQ